jgi:hypothetical protein
MYTKGQALWVIDNFQVVKVKYSHEIDHGGHGSGFREHFVTWPSGVVTSVIGRYTSEADATNELRRSVAYHLVEAEKAARLATAEVTKLQRIAAYLSEN